MPVGHLGCLLHDRRKPRTSLMIHNEKQENIEDIHMAGEMMNLIKINVSGTFLGL